ncbi:MAG: family 78 glycoside hydrolase catalytic domain, partial [Mediterranea sp.]|nr:family 78 glycoside hydrolase catalytic domain [Mediterranea sp.]
MKNLYSSLPFVLFLFCCRTAINAEELRLPTHLTTDLLEHTDRVFLDGYPANISLAELGTAIERYQLAEIHSAQPMLGWVMNSDQPNTLQTASHILVASSRELLAKDEADMWDSGRTESDNSVAVLYNGNPLQPATVYYWKVKTWDNHGVESPFSQVKSFITAQTLDGATARYPLQISDEYPVAIRFLKEGHTFIDFGKDAWGQLKLTLFSNQENDTVTIHLGEHIKDGHIDRDPDGSIRYSCYRMPLMSGTHTYFLKIRANRRHNIHIMPDYTGEVTPFRYCEIENYPYPMKPTDAVRQTVHYPFDETASMFHSSDTVLNQVWELCKYAIKATSFAGRYVDGDRERTTYEREALISQLGQYCV